MKSPINRRDFLKLGGLLPLSIAAPGLVKTLVRSSAAVQGQKNVILVVFDALSASNISLYGYQRETTPNIKRLAKRAIVYHNHFAGGNFTTSGTASLLTGTLPWTNRAMQLNSQVVDELDSNNLFNAFQDYYRAAFTHNSFAFTLLNQFGKYIEDLIPSAKLGLQAYDGFIDTLFYRDDDLAKVSWARDVKLQGGYSYSLFLSHLYSILVGREIASLNAEFPLGIPRDNSDNSFVLEQATGWMKQHLPLLPQPFLVYFHFLPPHAPYRTSSEFYRRFAKDALKLTEKPIDVFAQAGVGSNLLKDRTEYDEFILYADKAFGDLYDSLEKSGVLDNSWLVLTSDHGEMFERGLLGHGNTTLYQPVIRVPLMIFEPERKLGIDIHAPTSAVDILPTVAHVTGHPIPEWTEGIVLPPYGSSTGAADRSIYAVQSRKTAQNAPLKRASTMLVKGHYKLLYYFGYAEIDGRELVKLYDIEADPEELVDLYASQHDVAAQLLGELKSKIAEVNKPYL